MPPVRSCARMNSREHAHEAPAHAHAPPCVTDRSSIIGKSPGRRARPGSHEGPRKSQGNAYDRLRSSQGSLGTGGRRRPEPSGQGRSGCVRCRPAPPTWGLRSSRIPGGSAASIRCKAARPLLIKGITPGTLASSSAPGEASMLRRSVIGSSGFTRTSVADAPARRAREMKLCRKG